MIAVVGLLVILNCLSFGLLFICFVRIRDFSNNLQGLSERISVIEEMMVELAEAEGSEDVEIPKPEKLEVNIDKEEIPREDPVLVVADEKPENLNVEQERSRQVLELAQLGLSPEAIAKASGYNNGEVRLILNLYRSGHSIR